MAIASDELLDKAALAAARTTVKESQKHVGNYLKIQFSHNPVILPFEAGLQLMAAYKLAEEFRGDYQKEAIHPLTQNAITVTTVSNTEYTDRKMAKLLGVNYQDLIKAADHE